MDADGRSRDWSAELMEQGFSDRGEIYGDGAGGGSANRRKWTIDGYGFDDGGGTWAGYFSDDDSGQPTIASGSFTAVHGAVGRMGGGFGVDRQQ